jgi:hypothetical protein
MKQLTIRDIPNEVEQEIRKAAQRKGVSLNKAVLSLLEGKSGALRSGKKSVGLHHDLDHLCGILKRKEAADLDNRLALHRKIDEALWKR